MEDTTLSTALFNLTEMSSSGNYSEEMTSAAMPVFVMDAAMRNRNVLSSFLMFAAGVIGNLIALILMATSPAEQKRTMFYKLMAGLVFSDLVGTCATSPVVIYIYLNNERLETGMPLCHYFSFMLIFAGFATMSLVCAMAIERYICLCHPYAYHCKLPKSYAKYAFLASWMLSILIASLPLIGLGSNTVQFPETWCFFNSTSREVKDMAFNFLYAIIALICILVTFVCNIAAIVTVLSLKRRQDALSASQGPGIRRYRSLAQRFAELHMVVMLLGVTIIFTCCFGPLQVFTLICQTDLIRDKDISKAYLLIVRLASFNPILDPWVYLLVRRELRWKIVCVFKYFFRIRSKPALSGPLPEGQSPVLARRQQNMDTEMSCLTFCFHCLCDPPIQRSSASLARASASWAGQSNRSPSYIRRIPSSDSVLNGSTRGCIISQPSPSEELLLHKFSQSKTDLKTNGTTAGSLPHYGTTDKQ